MKHPLHVSTSVSHPRVSSHSETNAKVRNRCTWEVEDCLLKPALRLRSLREGAESYIDCIQLVHVDQRSLLDLNGAAACMSLDLGSRTRISGWI